MGNEKSKPKKDPLDELSDASYEFKFQMKTLEKEA